MITTAFILSERSDFHMIDNLLTTFHIFARLMLTSHLVDVMLLPWHENWSTNFRGWPLRLKHKYSVLLAFT